jgi:hypothetical protein
MGFIKTIRKYELLLLDHYIFILIKNFKIVVVRIELAMEVLKYTISLKKLQRTYNQE